MSDEYSGFIEEPTTEETDMRSAFTQVEVVPSAGYNRLLRGRRYGRVWMLKALKPEYSADPLYRELLKKEFDITVGMQHPGIVSAVSLETVDRVGECIVMEWIDGLPLDRWLEDMKPSHAERRRLFLDLLDAVGYVHSHQTVHRDLKPSNILVTRNGANVKLIDFGFGDTDSYAVFKQGAGTEGYLSPEQREGGETDVRNDIYSLGRLLALVLPEKRYRRVVERCTAGIERRYPSVSELRKAVVRCDARMRLRRVLVPAVAVVLAVASVFVVFVGRRSADVAESAALESALTTEDGAESGVAGADDASRGSIGDSDAGKSASQRLGDEMASVKEMDVMQGKPGERLNEIIEKGKRESDRYFAEAAWEQRIDTLTDTRYIEKDLDVFIKKMDRVAADYAASKGADDQERTSIKNMLLLYYNERYYHPYLSRISGRGL